MSNKLQLLLDWSEVWAPLIPITIFILIKQQPGFLKPVVVYLWLAFFLNLSGDLIADFKKFLPYLLQSNNPLYNLHSIIRFTCFTYFFVTLNQASFKKARIVLPIISVLFILINFLYLEDFFYPEHLSGNLLSAEAYLLLVYCMLYYLSQLRDDVEVITSGPDFWVVTGLCVYVVVNFFVFLFYVPMITSNPELADNMWDVHNIAYIIFCFFIAQAFYLKKKDGSRI